jgi:predicted AlkP superfamily phosphohydrolase/phosphomutase
VPGAVALLRRRVAASPLPPVRNWSTPEERASMRFFLSPNNTCFGGVRINLIGREPQGRVRPGAEYDAVCDTLAEDLLSLVNLDTGRPMVNAVSRLEDHYDREVADKLPDLLIDWSRDAPIETVWSPKTGIVHAPYVHWRTGDHRSDGLLLASGPGITAGADLGVVDMTDLGASLSARLGVPLPGDIDGRPVPWIADTAPNLATGQASASGVKA